MSYPSEIGAFDGLDKVFSRWAALLPPLPAGKGREPLMPQPFLQIMQRQARHAFEALTEFQSARAWSALRPFVEAPLILGKWLEDPHNAVVWLSRNSGKNARKEYQDVYAGDHAKPLNLPGADTFRMVLARISDDFLETQARYYARPLLFAPGQGRRSAEVGDDPTDLRAHLYAVLHLLVWVLHHTGRMLAPLCGHRPECKVDVLKLEHDFAAPAIALARENETHKNVLTQLGLWPHELLQAPRSPP